MDLLPGRAPVMTDATAAQAFLKEARQTVERLKAAELQDHFCDEYLTALKATVKPLDRLESHTAAIYPISSTRPHRTLAKPARRLAAGQGATEPAK